MLPSASLNMVTYLSCLPSSPVRAGTGYVSALLAHLASPGGTVLAIEKQVGALQPTNLHDFGRAAYKPA
jgi:protein-L-isoaspartate O-methyltransferase